MPRDYKNIKKNSVPAESRFSSLLTFLSGLSVGLLVAVLVFFYGNQIADSIGVKRPQVKTQAVAKAADTEQERPASMPKPTFEFYNILPNREVDVSAWVSKKPEQGESTVPQEEGNYILQVGSFKQLKAADQVKARLALLGFQAYIEPGIINGENTFRVRIGPYKNLTKLAEAQDRLLANDLQFMQMRL